MTQATLYIGLNISIHAPPRGATAVISAVLYDYKFQFTPLREGRQELHTNYSWRNKFQFTPLREGRHRRHCG